VEFTPPPAVPCTETRILRPNERSQYFWKCVKLLMKSFPFQTIEVCFVPAQIWTHKERVVQRVVPHPFAAPKKKRKPPRSVVPHHIWDPLSSGKVLQLSIVGFPSNPSPLPPANNHQQETASRIFHWTNPKGRNETGELTSVTYTQ
jgi:hypothetical protein